MADVLDSKGDQQTNRSAGASRSRGNGSSPGRSGGSTGPGSRSGSTRPGGFASVGQSRGTVRGSGLTHPAAPSGQSTGALASPNAGSKAGSGSILGNGAAHGPKQQSAEPARNDEASAGQTSQDPAAASSNSDSKPPQPAQSGLSSGGPNSGTQPNAAGSAQPAPVNNQKIAAPSTQPTQPGGPQSGPQGAAQGAALKAAAAGTGGLGAIIVKLAGNRKRSIIGTLALVGMLLLIGGFIISIPLELEEMSNLILGEADKVLDHTMDKAGTKILKKLMTARLSDPDTNIKVRTGHPLSDMIKNMAIKRFIPSLAEDKVNMIFDKSGRLVGFEQDGLTVRDLSDTSLAGRRAAIADLVESRIVGKGLIPTIKRVYLTKVLREHANVSWRFWPKEKIKSIVKLFVDKVRNGASANELEQATGEDKQKAQKQLDASQAEGSTEGGEGIAATETAWQKFGIKSEAIKAGIDSIKSHPYFGFVGIATMVCVVERIAQVAATNGYVERADVDIREGEIISTMDSQLHASAFSSDQTGITFQEFGEAMAVFNGNSSAPTDSTDRLGWDQSAYAKRDLGEPVDLNAQSPGYTPDLSAAANPDGFALNQIVADFAAVMSAIPGVNSVCHVLTGFFGVILSTGLQVVEAVADVALGDVDEVLASAAEAGLQTLLFGKVLPQALAAATNLGVTGPGSDNAVDSFNASQYGNEMGEQDIARSMGGAELTNQQEAQLTNTAQGDQVQYAAKQGWTWSTFALANPYSLLSQLILKIPRTPGKAIADMGDIPHNLSLSFGAIFLGAKPADAASTENINPNGLQFYGFTDAEINKYDPIANENFLAAKLPGTNKTRLSMLGDPSTYDPNSGDDPNTNDLLHCFVNKYSEDHVGIGMAPTDPNDICQGLGLVTTRNGNVVFNPTDQQIVNTIYCKDNGVCGLQANDDFLRYRLELLYYHVLTAINCDTTTQDCFTGQYGQ